MGIDFIRPKAKSFTKSWSRGREELAQPTLFTQHPECRSRTFVADMTVDTSPAPHSSLTAYAQDGSLVVVDGVRPIATSARPPPDLLKAIQDAGGCAVARIVRFNHISGTADVEIDE